MYYQTNKMSYSTQEKQTKRPKSKSIDDEGKPFKYFINLDTRNYISKQILYIEKYDGSVIVAQMEILGKKLNHYMNTCFKKEKL